MNIIIIKSALKDGLGVIERAVSESANLPILKNVLIETKEGGIVVSATNLEIATSCFVPAKIISTGKTTMPLGLLWGVVNNLPTERLSLEEKDGSVEIKTENYRAKIQSLPAEDFPIIPQVKEDGCVKISGATLVDSLSRVVAASQISDLRPELGSVLLDFNLDEIKLVATDSFRLAEKTIGKNQYQTDHTQKFRLLIPIKTAQEVYKITKEEEEVSIYHDQHQILFKTQRYGLVSRLIDGNFPDYTAILPKKFETEIMLSKGELLNALKLAGVFSSKVNEVRIKTSPDQKSLEIFSLDQSLGDNNYTLPAKIKGQHKEISFNWRYLAEGLKVISGDDVFWGINEDNKPALLKSQTEDSYFYILMPILKA